jgi:phosphopantetheine--protein transferase-like protein
MNSCSDGTPVREQAAQGDVAIIGMACTFPGAPDLRTYWQNIIAKVDAIGDPPADWEAELFYDPTSPENDRIYCKRGGYLGDLARFDPLKYGVMPNSIDGGDPDQFLALRMTYEALADAGYSQRPIDGERVEVIIGRGTYINRGFMNLAQHGVVVDQMLAILRQLHPEHSDDELRAIKRELKASLPPFNAEMAPALVPNMMSGRIANRLDFMGPNYTVDAACASSLIAVDQGMQDLLHGRCDLALVGGVHASTPAPILMVFCQLNALSRRGQIRPFDKDADGTLLGEGLGIIALKRRRDAERDGDRIYALIKGIGTASDGRALGLLAPRMEGEELALRRAYEAVGISPRTIELIEAHGTATPVGDVTEIQALSRVFGPRNGEPPWCAVGSVKSMISHLIPAAGVAGLIKSALALYHKVLPPTLNCDEPNPKLEIEKTPFYINTETRPWIHGAPTPRRAGVNAFGFGGINAHAVLEEYTGTREAGEDSYQQRWETEVCILQGDSRQDLLRQCEELHAYLSSTPPVELKDLAYTLNSELGESSHRLALVASSLEDVEHKLTRALERLADPQCVRIKDASGTYFFEQPLSRQGKLAFLFPGEGSQYINMLSDLCVHFPQVRAWFDLIDRAFVAHQRNYLPSQVIFPPPTGTGQTLQGIEEERLWQMDAGAEAVFTANQAMFSLLSQLHIRPQAVLGHSTGESSALVASGANPIDDEDYLIRGILDLNTLYERLFAEGHIAERVLLAVGSADRDCVLSLVEQSHGSLHLAMDNCPHQMVLCGSDPAVKQVSEQLRTTGAICTRLPFSRAYHTPLFRPFCDRVAEFFERLQIVPPQIDMYSCTTAQPYPRDPAEIRRLAVEQWARPIRFRETIEAMHEAGVRIFVEVGPRNNLTAFVDDILRGRPYLAIASNLPQRSGITQLNHLVALLAAHGVPMRLDYLYARRAPRRLSFDKQEGAGQAHRFIDGRRLAMGLQLLRLKRDRAPDKAAQTAPARAAAQSPAAAGSNASAAGREIPAEDTPPSGTAAMPSHARQWTAEPASTSSQTRRESPPAHTQRGSDQPRPSGSRSVVVQEYLHTMERFLDAQQEVMQAFLNGPGVVAPPTPRREEIHAKSPTPTDPPQLSPALAPHKPATAQANPEGASAPAARRLEVLSTPDAPVSSPQRQAEERTPGADGSQPPPGAIGQTLLTLVSERTGYPSEMLDLTLNMEADLGIDSIKRVEILGAFQRQTGLLQAQDMDRVTGLKTLQQIIDFLTQGERCDGRADLSPPQPERGIPPSAASPVATLPFIRTVTSFTPGQELVALCQIDLDEDLFLRDHTLGGRVSLTDERLMALPVVPLTISMEMLAEAAATLRPGEPVVGMNNIRAHRWIALDQSRLTLQLTARCKPSMSGREVEVRIKEFPDSAASESHPGTAIVEGTVVFGESGLDRLQAGEFPLQSERPSRWSPDRLYPEVMFHGPSWQGVASVDRTGEDGTEGTLRVLPTDHFFRSIPHPRFLTDPLLLDAAGQLVGFWTAEHLETGFHVFPFRVEAVHIYGTTLRQGELVQGRARVALMGEWQVRSDIDIVGPDGRLLMRLIGWWDRRFDLPDKFYRLRTSPQAALLSTPWPAPVAGFSAPEAFTCCLLDELSRDLLEVSGNIWQCALAHLVLNRRERETWRSLNGPEGHRSAWLLGQAAAKDAVRLFLKRRYGVELCPADIDISADAHERPRARGAWVEKLERVPVVSIAHADGIAVAVAGDDGQCHGIGIDIERLRRLEEGFENNAFTARERGLLSSLDASVREEWSLRLWCAKEAVRKAIGRGIARGPRTLEIDDFEIRTGSVEIALSGELIKGLPHLAARRIVVSTGQGRDFVFASVLI